MAYKKDQGRYVRMGAFWALFLLAAYGCLGGLVRALTRWLPAIAGDNSTNAWIQPFPLLGSFGLPQLIAILILSVVGVWIHGVLNRPKYANLLIDTENELKKVTWPSGSETVTGTIAVALTVVVLLLFLTGADLVLGFILDHTLSRRG